MIKCKCIKNWGFNKTANFNKDNIYYGKDDYHYEYGIGIDVYYDNCEKCFIFFATHEFNKYFNIIKENED